MKVSVAYGKEHRVSAIFLAQPIAGFLYKPARFQFMNILHSAKTILYDATGPTRRRDTFLNAVGFYVVNVEPRCGFDLIRNVVLLARGVTAFIAKP